MSKKIIFIVLAIIIIIAIAGLFTAEHYTSQSSFCGSCHIMKKYFNTWKSSMHGEKNVACVECHYPPGTKRTVKAKFKGLGQLFTYLGTDAKNVRKPARVSDSSCSTAECHPAEKFMDKKVQFTEKISYIHNTHIDKTIEGQTLHCDTCHQHVRSEKHFEVTRVACYLCHFKETKFNEGRARCSLCHEIPAGPLQKQKEQDPDADKAITHKSLEESQVPCWSCHYELVQGNGEIKKEDCFDCHEYSDEMLRKAEDKRVMHAEHVSAQNAKCFDCHSPILHEEVAFLDPVRESCFICHPDHHKYQKLIIIGDKRKDVTEASGLMYDVKTNCIGCHVEEKLTNGEKVLHGSAETCVACHTEKHALMGKEWKEKTEEELHYAREIEKEAKAAIEKARGSVHKEKLDRATIMLREGQENLLIVEYGGGVHNIKYAVKLLDAAMNNFEDVIDLLSEK
jgi:nitrate/TMAO reductase-like tetraheme cytochrome c subunit